MRLVIRLIANGIALAVASWILPGITVEGDSMLYRVLTLVVVAAVFGLVNAIVKPIVTTVGCAFIVITLGLMLLVINGLMLWLTSWICGQLGVGFHVTGFWPAFWGGIILAVVGSIMQSVLGANRVRD